MWKLIWIIIEADGYEIDCSFHCMMRFLQREQNVQIIPVEYFVPLLFALTLTISDYYLQIV